MKKFRYKSIVILAFLLAGCQAFVENTSEFDPTRPVDADMKLVVTGMEVEFIGTMEGDLARTAGMWSGYFTGVDRQYIPLNNYVSTAVDYVTAWNNVYSFTLKQSRIVQDKANVLGDRITLGIAQIIEANIIGTAAALWGDIPYSQAINLTQFPNPAYDPQAQVIASLLPLLDAAIANLNSGVGTTGGNLPLNATTTQYIAAAHSLKARYYLYQKDYANALAEANLGVSSNANNITGKHGTTNDQDRNIYYDFTQRQRVGYMTAKSAFLPQRLTARASAKTDETARLKFFYTGGVGAYDLNVSATGFFGSASSFPIVTYYETRLIAAEADAKLNNGITVNGLAALNAVRAALAVQFPTGKYLAYVAADFADVNAFIKEVQEEKWIDLIGQIEGFNEIRRTNNSVGVPINVGTQLPQRYIYSQNEINSNTSTPNPIPDLFTKTAIFQ